ncbi:MAG: hypothetical protein ABXS91_08590 [Sulfurimonas sp.]
MLFPNELINLHKDREKTITDTWIAKKGIEVTIKPVKIFDNGAEISHDLDPFGVGVNTVGYEEGSIGEYENEIIRKIVFVNEQFQFSPISHDMMLEDILGSDESSNMNEVFCFIEGDLVPKYSELTFTYFGSMVMRIEEITKKRPLSDIHKYKLVRC